MTVESAITAGFVAAANADRALRTLITGLATGNLSTLTTTNKASIIAAINELEDSINNVIDDLTDDSETTTYSAFRHSLGWKGRPSCVANTTYWSFSLDTASVRNCR